MQKFNKKWIQIDKFFKLEVNNIIVGEMEILLQHKFPKHCVNMNINGNDYYIKNTGPWESTVTIYDYEMNIVLSSKHTNWNLKKYLITLGYDFYEVRLETASQPTWHLLEKGKKLISYSTDLQTNEIFVSEYTDRNIPTLLDFLLLYLTVFQ